MSDGDVLESAGEALLERIADIARRLAESDGLDETLQRIVDLAVANIRACDGATLMLVRRGGRIVTPASTNVDVLRADQAQYETGQGPCLSAMQEHETIVIDEIATDQRWPAWRDAVAGRGLRSMIGLRLFVADDTMGALNVYARVPAAFGARERALAQVFASHAAVAMKAAINEAGLESALASRDVIGQAKGVLMERERITGDEAFDRLRTLSNERNVGIRDLAEEIVRTGDIPG